MAQGWGSPVTPSVDCVGSNRVCEGRLETRRWAAGRKDVQDRDWDLLKPNVAYDALHGRPSHLEDTHIHLNFKLKLCEMFHIVK